MKKIYVLILFLLAWANAFSQSVSPTLIGSGGDQTDNATYKTSWSIGEPITGIGMADNLMLTQGFHQGSFAPLAPVATEATSITTSRFTANWNALVSVPLVDYYLLDVSTDPHFGSFFGVFHDFNVGNVTTYPVTGLTPGTIYYYRLRAHNSDGIGLYSNIIIVSPAIPTLSEWGLIIFGIMLVAISTVYILRGYGHSA